MDKVNPIFNFDVFNIRDVKIESEDELLIQRDSLWNERESLFTLKTANEWIELAKSRPIPNMLFDEFWYQGELCILFADTNLGKSILAVQIGNSISKGEPIPGFRLETPKQPILYFDFELSNKQFQNRYSLNYTNNYIFDENFIRVEINPEVIIPEGQNFEDILIISLEKCIIDTGSTVLIIDNLTYLKSDTERAKDALPLMKHLKALKNKYGLSILALAHTPKRDLTKPITRNDLQGSKMLMSFTDSSFTIGESQKDKSVRYLKQIKVRQNEFIFDEGNVCICSLNKPANFLLFEFTNYGKERDHLKQQSDKDEDELLNQIVLLKEEGNSFREIASQIGISHMKVSRMLKKL